MCSSKVYSLGKLETTWVLYVLDVHLEAGTFYKVVMPLCHTLCSRAFKHFMKLSFYFCIEYKSSVIFEEMYSMSSSESGMQ